MQTPSTQMPTFTWQRTHFRPADKFAPTVHFVHTQAYNIYALFTRSFRTVRWFRVNGLGTFSLSCPLILSLLISLHVFLFDITYARSETDPGDPGSEGPESIRLEDFSKVLN